MPKRKKVKPIPRFMVLNLRQEQELLRQLACGEREIAQVRGHSLKSVLREADNLLNAYRSH